MFAFRVFSVVVVVVAIIMFSAFLLFHLHSPRSVMKNSCNEIEWMECKFPLLPGYQLTIWGHSVSFLAVKVNYIDWIHCRRSVPCEWVHILHGTQTATVLINWNDHISFCQYLCEMRSFETWQLRNAICSLVKYALTPNGLHGRTQARWENEMVNTELRDAM